jgi:hypothetical protein
MKAQEQIPEGVLQAQSERLTEDEFNFCKKLFNKIALMKCRTKAQREDVLNYIQSQSTKYNGQLSLEEPTPKELEIWNFYVNNKRCYVVFDILGNSPVNLIPSGVLFQRTN